MLVLKGQQHFQQARETGGIDGVTDVGFDGAKGTKLVGFRLFPKDARDRFKLNGIPKGRARAMGFHIGNGGRVNVGFRIDPTLQGALALAVGGGDAIA